jgi:hypothetical protein
MTAAVAPNAQQRLLILDVFCQLNGLVSIRHWMPVDFLDDVARLETGLSRG